MRARRALLALLSCLAFAALAVPASASGLDSDGDGVPDDFDNCDLVAQTWQHDADGDGLGNLCDPTPYTSVDGRISGGGQAYHLFHDGVLFSLALRSSGGKISGTGRVHDTMTGTTVRIIEVDSLWVGLDSIGREVGVATGTALVNGVEERFYFETQEGEIDGRGGDYIEIRTDSYTFGGHVRVGNLEAD